LFENMANDGKDNLLILIHLMASKNESNNVPVDETMPLLNSVIDLQ
jgi:hypothetical protein